MILFDCLKLLARSEHTFALSCLVDHIRKRNPAIADLRNQIIHYSLTIGIEQGFLLFSHQSHLVFQIIGRHRHRYALVHQASQQMFARIFDSKLLPCSQQVGRIDSLVQFDIILNA